VRMRSTRDAKKGALFAIHFGGGREGSREGEPEHLKARLRKGRRRKKRPPMLTALLLRVFGNAALTGAMKRVRKDFGSHQHKESSYSPFWKKIGFSLGGGEKEKGGRDILFMFVAEKDPRNPFGNGGKNAKCTQWGGKSFLCVVVSQDAEGRGGKKNLPNIAAKGASPSIWTSIASEAPIAYGEKKPPKVGGAAERRKGKRGKIC